MTTLRYSHQRKTMEATYQVLLPFRSGVYRIANRITGEAYIGATHTIGSRVKGHFMSLRKGDHKNRFLQASFDQYGEAAFSAEVLEFLDENLTMKELNLREKHHIGLEPRPFNVTNHPKIHAA